MVSDEVLLGLAIGFALLVMLVGTGCALRDNTKAWEKVDLNKSLVEDSDGRVEDAKAVAKGDSHQCPYCGFDNFSHVQLCAVCGDALGDDKTRKKILKKRANNNKPVVARHGKRRHEWTRKVDVEGKHYWFRKSSSTDAAPSFVARFSGPFNGGNNGTATPVLWLDPSTVNALDFTLRDGVLTGVAAPLVALGEQPFAVKYTEFVERATELVPADGSIRLRFNELSTSSALQQLARLASHEVRTPISIEYIPTGTGMLTMANSLKAMDWSREWHTAIHTELADPATGLFVCANAEDQSYAINPAATEAQATAFFATGRLLGRHLLHGDLLSFHLSRPLLKLLLGQPVGVSDLEDMDPVLATSLQHVLVAPHAESLSLDFTMDGVELVPNGCNIPVTDANKHEYVTRVAQHVLVERVALPLQALCSGFYSVVPLELLLLLDAEELDYLLCGADTIDVEDWERNSKYNQWLFEHPSKKYFWRYVAELPVSYQRNLLHFATGSYRVPVGGFAMLKSWDGRRAPFALNGVEPVDCKFFKGEPCFNRLTLPLYNLEKKTIKEMLWTMFDPQMYPFVLQASR